MTLEGYPGSERRIFKRLDYVKPLAFKVCKKETLSRLLEGYTSNISESGILCNIEEKVREGDILWLSFDRGTLNICEEIEKKSLIYQNGVIGKVVRIEPRPDASFNIGLRFVTRQELNFFPLFMGVNFTQEG